MDKIGELTELKDIIIEWAAVHTADSSLGSPILASRGLDLDEDLRDYFETHIISRISSTQARMGKFPGLGKTVAAACERMMAEGSDCFLESSEAIAWWLHQQIGGMSAVTVDLAVCVFQDENSQRYIALLKLDPMRMYVRDSSDKNTFEQILVLPDATHGLKTWAIIRPYQEEVRYDLLYAEGKGDEYWHSHFLECEDVATPRQLTKLVIAETGKWLDENAETISPEVASELAKTVKETAKQNLMDLEELAERVIPNSVMRDDYIGRLLDKGLTETRFEPDARWAEQRSRKTTYVLDYGVTISGPSDAIDSVVQMMPKAQDGKTRLVIETKKFYEK